VNGLFAQAKGGRGEKKTKPAGSAFGTQESERADKHEKELTSQ